MNEKKNTDEVWLRHIELGELLDLYGGLLTEKQQRLLDLTVNADLSLAEVAEEEGVSRQAVHEAIRRAENSLRRLEEQLSLRSIRHQSQALLQEMTDALTSSESEEGKTSRCLALTDRLKQTLDQLGRS